MGFRAYINSFSASFQTTYEELKHISIRRTAAQLGFQTTYEELKHIPFSLSSSGNFRFQTTYEELKRENEGGAGMKSMLPDYL